MKKLFWFLTAIIVIAVALFFFRGRWSPQNNESIKIGAMLVLSGDGAAWGENARKSIDLAVQEVNEVGGINGRKIAIIYEDTEGDAKKAVSAYQKLFSLDHVDAIIGPLFQTEVGAVAPLIAKEGVPVVAPSYANLVSRPVSYNPLLIWMDATVEAERMADYIYKQGMRIVSVVGTKDAWESEVSNAFVARFTSLGGRIVFKELVQSDVRDVRLTITKAVKSNPDAIFLGTYFQFIPSLKRIHELVYKGKLYSIEVDAYLAGETKGISDGLQFIAPDFYTSEFQNKFQKKYAENAGIPAGQTYDAMNILISLLKNNSTREAMLLAMSHFQSYNGVSGKIEVTPDKHTLLPTAIFELRGGNISKVSQ